MRYSKRFLVITAVFVTTLITSNIIAVKIVGAFGMIVPAAVIIFPISYIIGDVLTEVYGYARARLVIWIGFGCNLLAVLAIVIAIWLPPAAIWDGQEAFGVILGFAPRLLAASLVAYLIGEFANSYVLARMKIATKGRMLWARTIGSTLVGQGLDSLVFLSIAFGGVFPAPVIAHMIVTQWLVKSAFEALATPITYWVTNWLKKVEQVDAYDHETSFNPFSVSDVAAD